MRKRRQVVVVGLDGLEPSIVEPMLQSGELPHLARLVASGGYARVATTTPAQTPVAWSTFATGVNPGGHGIFDFLRRDPATYLPDLGLSTFRQRSMLLPPEAVNLRGGTTLWEVLGEAGIPSAVLRCPCTFPPTAFAGRLLAGMGVPDIRGGIGTATILTSDRAMRPGDGEQVVVMVPDPRGWRGRLVGPRHPRTRADVTLDVIVTTDGDAATVEAEGGTPRHLPLAAGNWSDWLHIRFRTGVLTSVAGMVRFLLVRTSPHLELYASPVNFDPRSPLFPVSHPPRYAAELAAAIGLYHTTGMVEDHGGLTNGRFDEGTFLAQVDLAFREREAMLQHELARQDAGLVYCLFDTPDRVQHMFWRFGEPDHPANRASPPARAEYAAVIRDWYRRCDAVVGRVVAACGPGALVLVASDHGFSSFRRGIHLNAWLVANGYLVLGPGDRDDSREFLAGVDWGRSRAYALGFGGIYLNVRGREAGGIVAPGDADATAAAIARRLTGWRDPESGVVAIRSAHTRDELYRGEFAAQSPDVVVGCEPGYRASWATALGGVPAVLVEDNVRKWGGDHIIDPRQVPGVLFMNEGFDGTNPALVDLAPTVLEALGCPVPAHYEGRSLVAAG